MPETIANQSPAQFANAQLAERIAARLGVETQTFSVKMVGTREVKDLLRKMEILSRRDKTPSAYRIR